MRAYVLTVVVIDFDDVEAEGPGSIGRMIENARYPNRCIDPDVMHTRAFDIGEWHDGHPLNYSTTNQLAWLIDEGTPCAPGAAKREEDARRKARDKAGKMPPGQGDK